jgi:Uma2 family endonuclease
MHRPADSTETATQPDPPEPAWEVARLFPEQGSWSEQEYLDLNGNRLVEFSHGSIEVLTMPTMAHQLMVLFLYEALKAFVAPRNLGRPLVAPLRVRLWPGKIREPDVIFMLQEHSDRMGDEVWDGADLVMEVVSNDDRRRDLETKRFEYARAGIPEYWIVDPQTNEIIVLRLDGERYVVHGEFKSGERATSMLLNGFEVDVAATFAAGQISR